MGFWDGIGGSVSGSLLDVGGSFLANDWNKRAAQRSMDFTERMSSTAYQRGTADMRKAGLNPMLAYAQGGASTPSGTAISSSVDVGDISSSARDSSRLRQETKESGSRIDSQKAAAEASYAVAEANRANASRTNAQAVPEKMMADFLIKHPWVVGTEKFLDMFGGTALKVGGAIGAAKFGSGWFNRKKDRSGEILSPGDLSRTKTRLLNIRGVPGYVDR